MKNITLELKNILGDLQEVAVTKKEEDNIYQIEIRLQRLITNIKTNPKYKGA